MIPLPTAPTFTTAFPSLSDGRPSKRPANVRAKAFRASLRRRAQLKAAADVLPHLPGPGESCRCLMTGTFDLMLVITVIIQARPSPCTHLRISTLAFSKRNVAELCKLTDAKLVGKLTLLCSDFMAKSNAAVFKGAMAELVDARKQTVASARTHCKAFCLEFADGMQLVGEGSANLRSNGNKEQLTVINDRGVFDFHAEWIDREVAAHAA